MEEGKRLLAETGMTVAEAAEKSGFRDPGYFGRVFRKATGMNPSAYRKKCRREDHTGNARRPVIASELPERKYSAFAVEKISNIS